VHRSRDQPETTLTQSSHIRQVGLREARVGVVGAVGGLIDGQGLSQVEFVGLVGRSESWVSQVGRLDSPNWRLVLALKPRQGFDNPQTRCTRTTRGTTALTLVQRGEMVSLCRCWSSDRGCGRSSSRGSCSPSVWC
jgi:hypothetical protein